jgi:hypothetical protein
MTIGVVPSTLKEEVMKLCAMTSKENKMHIERENRSVFPKVTQVSDVVHGPLV